jgi:hypothetical protein
MMTIDDGRANERKNSTACKTFVRDKLLTSFKLTLTKVSANVARDHSQPSR